MISMQLISIYNEPIIFLYMLQEESNDFQVNRSFWMQRIPVHCANTDLYSVH